MSAKSSSKYVNFYAPAFRTKRDAQEFVESLESLGAADPRHQAKIMMHQAQRLISLADDLPSMRKGNETLPLLFLLVCAEHMAKLFENFAREGQSKAYVHKFFDFFLSDEQKESLGSGIAKRGGPKTLRTAVDILYAVRCDAVHEGRYWGFHFGRKDSTLNDDGVVASITFKQFRSVVLAGCITAIERYVAQQQTRDADQLSSSQDSNL